MIQDSDENILLKSDIVTKALQCVECFTECYTMDARKLKSNHIESWSNESLYDMDLVRNFYNSRTPALRKHLKKHDITVSVKQQFGFNSSDSITYSFHWNGRYLFTLRLFFTNKNISKRTYEDLQYDVVTEENSVVSLQTLNLTYDTIYRRTSDR